MPRVVERDHRSEELRDLGREVADPDVGVRAIDMWMTTCEMDVVELRHRPVARTSLEHWPRRFAPKRDRCLTPQRRERAVTEIVGVPPELRRAQIDFGKRNLCRRYTVDARRN